MKHPVIFAIAAVLCGAIAGSAATAGADPLPRVDDYASTAKPTFAINPSGHSFGSAAKARTPDEEPDLISATGDHGVVGYVYKKDLDADQPQNPADAVRRAKSGSPARTVTVYDSTGTKKLDTFTLFAVRAHAVTPIPVSSPTP